MSLYPTSVAINDATLARLTSTLKGSYKDIVQQILTATNFGIANRKQILAQIETHLEDMGVNVDEFLAAEIPNYYKQGADEAIKQLNNVGAPINVKAGFARVHKDAIEALVSDTSTSFGETITGVSRSANQLLGVATRKMLTQKIATGVTGGEALRQVKQQIKGVLQEQGLDTLIDKGGNSWSLDRYSEMLFRTKAVEARNRGLINRIAENEYDLVQVSSHGADDVCGDWEGVILSITGDTPGYETVDDAEADGLFHPNCKHALNAIIPSLAEQTNAYDPDVDTLSPEDAELPDGTF